MLHIPLQELRMRRKGVTQYQRNALIKSIINFDGGARILIKTQWGKVATGCKLGAECSSQGPCLHFLFKHLRHPQRISIDSNYFYKEMSCKLSTRLLKTGNIEVLYIYNFPPATAS